MVAPQVADGVVERVSSGSTGNIVKVKAATRRPSHSLVDMAVHGWLTFGEVRELEGGRA